MFCSVPTHCVDEQLVTNHSKVLAGAFQNTSSMTNNSIRIVSRPFSPQSVQNDIPSVSETEDAISVTKAFLSPNFCLLHW